VKPMAKSITQTQHAPFRPSGREEMIFDDEAARLFNVLYQPLVDLDTGGVAGFSAGATWIDPERERRSPAGLSVGGYYSDGACERGLNVVNHVVRGLSEWIESGEAPGLMLVGLDPWGKDRCGAGPLERAPELLAKSGVAPSRLMFFFDVDSLMERPADALDLGIGLKRRGLGVGVDNIDPAFAPYNFLEMFPADVLRLRLRDAGGLKGDGELAQWLSSVSAFADNLLMDVAVEGVENAGQYKLIKSLGCRYAQGGFFSRPLVIERAMEYYRSADISPYLLGG